jgi:BirA family biotin operon repressor/biotin-[acetyl-CoA-carboxylase] ligase
MTMSHWDAETLWQDLEPLAPGLSVEVRAEVDSTNTRLLERPRQGDTLPCLLVAECQTAGRGRLGRTWWSQPGQSLTFSLGLRLAPADWSGLSLAVGLALAEALGEHVGLKWPNDLWLRGEDRKLGGILIEVVPLPGVAERPGERWVVIGAGLNVTPIPDAEVEAGAFRTGHASLQAFEPTLTAPQVLHRITRPLLQSVRAFESTGLGPLHPRLAARDVLAGRQVQAGAVTGTVMGLSEDGSLRVRDAHGTVHSLHSGEVSVRPC